MQALIIVLIILSIIQFFLIYSMTKEIELTKQNNFRFWQAQATLNENFNKTDDMQTILIQRLNENIQAIMEVNLN